MSSHRVFKRPNKKYKNESAVAIIWAPMCGVPARTGTVRSTGTSGFDPQDGVWAGVREVTSLPDSQRL